MQDIAVVIGLLGACLVALILVLLARREADAVRRQATEDVQSIRDEARALLADTERRSTRIAEREQGMARTEQVLSAREQAAAERERAAAEARQQAEDLRRAAAREQADASEAAARTGATAQRAATDLLAEAEVEAIGRLETAAGLTAAEARAELLRRLTDEATQDASAIVRRIEAQARRTAEARARRVVATALHRTAVPTSTQAAVTLLPLPSDEMKGRIIGKEGRNIRVFEALTGVNVLVDDTPGSVALSCFDVERREVAEVTLDTLMTDGRITPQRIEAAYAEALAGVEQRADEAGGAAAERAGVRGLDAELVRVLGRLRLRGSYGQDVLEHSVESALLAAQVAVETGADVDVARRAALLHDIGKAVTGEVPGTHAQVGAALAARHGESDVVVNAIAAHHDEVPQQTVEAVLVQVADSISAARPGARRDDIDQHVERLEKLEALVTGHAGVRRALAMAAGRELRVVVEPSEVPDEAMGRLATDIARHIEAELSYPGEITVTVVREVRASATAG
ncbi:MAG TPA: ribonuclease Y [Cellulomonas sp.]